MKRTSLPYDGADPSLSLWQALNPDVVSRNGLLKAAVADGRIQRLVKVDVKSHEIRQIRGSTQIEMRATQARHALVVKEFDGKPASGGL